MHKIVYGLGRELSDSLVWDFQWGSWKKYATGGQDVFFFKFLSSEEMFPFLDLTETS